MASLSSFTSAIAWVSSIGMSRENASGSIVICLAVDSGLSPGMIGTVIPALRQRSTKS